MNYIGLLTPEEKVVLCELITGREFKELFKRNEQEFSRIRKGFRAKSLTEQQALSIAIVNSDKSFILTWINATVSIWLQDIQKNIEKLEEEGLSHTTALATTMLDSFFADNVALYFKLTGEMLESDAYSKLCKEMDDVKSDRIKSTEMDKRISAMEEEKRQLLEQIEAAKQKNNAIKIEYEQKIQAIERDNETLKSLLSEAQERIAALQVSPNVIKGNNADQLAQFDDTDTSLLPAAGSDEIVSLYGVSSNYNGKKQLIRYADMDCNGYYSIFRRSENSSFASGNWYKIFYKDGPVEEDFYGIWSCVVVPNENDPSKDYILSRFNANIDAIEVVTVTEATSLDELIELLKNGIEYQPHSRRTIFSSYAAKGQYMGIMCNLKELNIRDGKASFAEDCIEVPVYEFTRDDILYLDNGLTFYKKAFAGIPSKLYQLKSTLDIVKDIVFSSISWSAYKTRSVTRSEYRTFKDFIGAIPVDDITYRIENACRCSSSTAQELLNEFLNAVWKYVEGDSLEDAIILSAISASSELQDRAKSLVRADWEAENTNLLAETQKKLDSLNAQLKTATANLAEVQDSLNKTKLEEEHLSCIIAEKKKLAENVETAIAERIHKARENVADFIADMAFVGGAPAPVIAEENSVIVDSSAKTTVLYRTVAACENLGDLEAHHSWKEVIDTTAFEIGEAGVAESYRGGLAAFLCAAYINKQPILLVGPNAIDIAQAFSAAVAAQKCGILSCEGDYSSQITTKIGADGEDIVIINNLISSGWINRIPEILSQKDVFYIATHPYPEDIQVEPKSLYGFMLPLFTEFVVDKTATGKYYGGYFADDFKPYSVSKGPHKELKILSKLSLSSLVRNQLNSLVSTMYGIHSATTADEEFLLVAIPIAYASLEIDTLKEAIADPQKGIAISTNLKRSLRYFLGEV